MNAPDNPFCLMHPMSIDRTNTGRVIRLTVLIFRLLSGHSLAGVHTPLSVKLPGRRGVLFIGLTVYTLYITLIPVLLWLKKTVCASWLFVAS